MVISRKILKKEGKQRKLAEQDIKVNYKHRNKNNMEKIEHWAEQNIEIDPKANSNLRPKYTCRFLRHKFKYKMSRMTFQTSQ